MTKSFTNLGGLIRNYRVSRNMTQVEFGETIGVIGQAISNVERGNQGIPMKRMPKLVKALGLSPAERRNILKAIMNDEANFAREVWAAPLGLE